MSPLMAPEAAVSRAFWTVKVPSLVLLFTPWVGFVILAKVHCVPSTGSAGLECFLAAFLGGFAAGWLAWSMLVPRWRLWAYQQVDDIEALKRAAAVAHVIWPQGHPFE